jgi:glycosyltransferase involved in cell wall biosynthesis
VSSKPRVSVVVPVFNGASYLSDAISSVLSQTVREIEVIVVDDGSTDTSADVIAGHALRDRRIVEIRQENRGLPAARNAGVQLARADLVAFLDADDVWLPEKLARQLAHLEANSACQACFTYAEEVDNSLRLITPWSALEAKYGLALVRPEHLVEHGNLVVGSGSSVLALTRSVHEVGGFDERMVAAEDLDLWYRLALRAPVQAVPEVLVRIRRSPGQMQSDYSRVLRGRIQFLENVRRGGDESHRKLASRIQRHLRAQLIRRSLRRGQLVMSGAQALALLSGTRMRHVR